VIGGGSILVLQKILGHTSLAMTMRYAHLAPDHLQEALRLNPFDTFSTLSESEKAPLKS
jgi:site-specific recombinase XerD